MTRWSAWRSVLAGAVLGFVDAAQPVERAGGRPAAIVRYADRLRHPPRPRGLWFLGPLRGWRSYLHRN